MIPSPPMTKTLRAPSPARDLLGGHHRGRHQLLWRGGDPEALQALHVALRCLGGVVGGKDGLDPDVAQSVEGRARARHGLAAAVDDAVEVADESVD